MKKLICTTLVCISFLAALGSCEKDTVSPSECGKEVVSLMSEMASNEDWMTIRNIPEMYNEAAAVLRAGDYTKISAVYEITLPDEALLPLLSDAAPAVERLPENLREYLRDSMSVALISHINASAGNKALAVSSLYSAQMFFGNCPDTESTVYLYVFENGCPIAVSVTEGENGAIRANGNFILNSSLNTENAESIEQSLENMGFRGADVVKQ